MSWVFEKNTFPEFLKIIAIQNEYYRIGDWKFVKGTTYEGEWDNWYGPSGRTGYTYPMEMVR